MAGLKPNTTSRLSAPSPTPSNSSTGAPKRKRPADEVTVYSQPTDTGKGEHVFTQLTYTIDHLRNNAGRWLTFKEITDYLNIHSDDQVLRDTLLRLFRSTQTTRIEFDPKNQTYRYRPKYDIRNGNDLKRHFQEQKSAQGLSVKDLKDGWPDVQAGVRELEAKKELLVIRNRKDDTARTVWINDPSLMHNMDDDFKHQWNIIQLPPNPDELRAKLLAAGLKPSSVARTVGDGKPKEKRKKKARAGGKQTNTHMAGILKDFSHLRK